MDDDVDPDDLAARTAGFTGAEVRSACDHAARAAIRDILAHEGPATAVRITREHLLQALDVIRRSPRMPDSTANPLPPA